jgi:hypothetical protein
VSVTREIWSPTLQRTVLKLRAQRAAWRLPKAFEDGQALWDAICEHELEGVVAKRLDEPYLCGERSGEAHESAAGAAECPRRRPGPRSLPRPRESGLILRIRVANAVTARDGLPLAVATRGTRRETLAGANIDLVAALGASVGAG